MTLAEVAHGDELDGDEDAAALNAFADALELLGKSPANAQADTETLQRAAALTEASRDVEALQRRTSAAALALATFQIETEKRVAVAIAEVRAKGNQVTIADFDAIEGFKRSIPAERDADRAKLDATLHTIRATTNKAEQAARELADLQRSHPDLFAPAPAPVEAEGVTA